METILSIISGSIGGVIVIALLRGWITERLKQSIQHEYAQKLETHKSELNSKFQAITFENQLNQLRTSLFFDHQREAFAKILSKIFHAMREWWKTYDPEEGGLIKAIPSEAYKDVWQVYNDHRLFFDRDCACAIELVIDYMRDSFPFDDGSGELHESDCRRPFDSIEYLQDRLPELFQEKIGLVGSGRAKLDIAYLGAIKILNSYQFMDIGLPPQGIFRILLNDSPADSVRKAEQNRNELINKLIEFYEYLRRDPSCFYGAAIKVKGYLKMLSYSQLDEDRFTVTSSTIS